MARKTAQRKLAPTSPPEMTRTLEDRLQTGGYSDGAELSAHECRAIASEIELGRIAAKRLAALKGTRVHWAWGLTSDDFMYCCAFRSRVFRERSLEALADRLIQEGGW